MKKEVFRLVFGCSLTIAAGLAFGQNHSTGPATGGSGGGGTVHSSGGNGGNAGGGGYQGGGNAGGGVNRNTGGGYQPGNGMRGGSNTSSSGNSQRTSGSQNQSNNGSRYSGGYSNGGNTGTSNRYQSGGGNPTSGTRTSNYYQNRSSGYSQTRGSSTSQSRPSGYTGSRYSGPYGYSGAVHTGINTGRTASIGEKRVVAQNGFDHGHANLSRSGQVTYSSSNNRYGVAGVTGTERFGPPHHGLIHQPVPGRLNGGRHGLVIDGWRSGYFGYWGGWRDSFFAFPFYVFEPWDGPCYCSPWYYYPCLPPYIAAPQGVIVDSYPSANFDGDDYNWAPGNNSSPNIILDDSIEDVVQAFEADDHTALDRVVPHSGNVNIYTDGKYGYTLKANDFYDTYVDGIESTKTDHYEIMDVKASKDGATARVTAKHVYNDPWGNRTYVYHSYFLVKEGDEYVIREFGTSDNSAG